MGHQAPEAMGRIDLDVTTIARPSPKDAGTAGLPRPRREDRLAEVAEVKARFPKPAAP